MFPTAEINYLAVLVSAIVSTVLGSLWYGPLFGKIWMKLSGIDPKSIDSKKKGMWKLYLTSFIASMVFAFILAHFIDYLAISTITNALFLAFMIWLGFTATLLLGTVLWEGKSIRLYILNAGYRLVELFIIAIILTLWR